MGFARELINKFQEANIDRLTTKQMSIRPTIRLAAKINAVFVFFKETSRTDIVNELLAAAISDMENAMDEETRKGFEEAYKECLIEILNRPEEKLKR